MRVFQQDHLHLPQDLHLRVVSPINVWRHLAAVLGLEGYGVLRFLCLWFRLFRLLPCALLLASSTAFLGAQLLRIQQEEEDVMVLRRASWRRSGGLGSGLATCVVAALVVARCAPLVVSAHAELVTHTRPRHMTEEA